MARLVLRPAIPATPAAEDCRRGEKRIVQELPLLPYASCSVRRLLLHRWHAPERPVQQQVRCPPPPPAGCSRGTGAVRDWVAGSYAAQACALAAAAASAASCLNCQGTCRTDSTDADTTSCRHRCFCFVLRAQGSGRGKQLPAQCSNRHTAVTKPGASQTHPLQLVVKHVTIERKAAASVGSPPPCGSRSAQVPRRQAG